MSDRIIQKQKIIPAPLSVVWQKWTTETGIKSFFAPDCKVEMRPGGAYEMYFLLDNPEELRGGEGCKILSFLPEKMLSFSWNSPPEIPTIRALGDVAWVVVFFEKNAENQTLIELNHLGFGDGEDWDKTYDYFVKAWDKVLDWLVASFK